MRTRLGVLAICLAVAAMWGSSGCAKQLPTQVETAGLTSADKLEQNGGVTVFRVSDTPDRVAVRFAMVATRLPGSRGTVLLSIEDAEQKLAATDRARLVTVWRYYPASRAFDRGLVNEMPSEREFLASLTPAPSTAGDSTSDSTVVNGEDPPPPDPEPILSCPCLCSCCSTWGCVKCCYR